MHAQRLDEIEKLSRNRDWEGWPVCRRIRQTSEACPDHQQARVLFWKPVGMHCTDIRGTGPSPGHAANSRSPAKRQQHLKVDRQLSQRLAAREPFQAVQRSLRARQGLRCRAETAQAQRSPLRLIQHKDEAFWFYRFLSIVYDKIGWRLLHTNCSSPRLIKASKLPPSTTLCMRSQSWSLDGRHAHRRAAAGPAGPADA